MNEFIRSVLLLLVLLNPFLVIVYLIDIVDKLDTKQFQRVLFRAGIISSVAFCCFAILGDKIFSDVFQVAFCFLFNCIGGIVFLIIGLQFVFRGPTAIEIIAWRIETHSRSNCHAGFNWPPEPSVQV